MADFRKLLLVLIAGAFLFAAVASADNYACSATAVPTLARAEGLAEQMGDVLLKCAGTVPTTGLIANIRLTLTTYITSPNRGPFTDATMILDEGIVGGVPQQFKGYPSTTYIPFADGSQNVYQAVRISDTEVEWQDVVLAGPGSAGYTTIRLTNVRGNANRLGDAGNATIQAYVNITAPTAVPVNNNLVTVADTRIGLTFSVTSGTFKNCVSPTSIVLKFREGFSNAFRPVLTAGAPNVFPGGPYANESGWNPGPGALATGSVLASQALIGMADQGTRLMSRVKNNPSGVRLTFPNRVVVSDGNTPVNGMTLQIVSSPNADGSGGTVTSDNGSTTFTDSAFLVVYEVVSLQGASISFQETVPITVGTSYSIPGPLGTGTASGTFATLSTIAKASDSSSATTDFKRALVPRFVDKGVDTTWYTINPCRTILLFPYITQAGVQFDTGIAIANTSMDPWGTLYGTGNATVPQAGACRLFYYGSTNGGAAPAMQTSPIVPAGGELIYALSSGGGVTANGGTFTACAAGNCIAPLFTGYMFAVCDFQFAHGYAFISDYGAQKLAQGYLALIVPDIPFRDPGNRADTAFGSDLNAGEQLSN